MILKALETRVSALLKAERLEAFYGASQVLHGIDLELQRGEQIALIGRNGMGKTTFLRALMGLVENCRGSVHSPGATSHALRLRPSRAPASRSCRKAAACSARSTWSRTW